MQEATKNLILTRDDRGVATLTFNRPNLHNAFDGKLIADLIIEFKRIELDPSIRVLVLTGSGKSFSAGADLNWMRKMINYSKEQNYDDAVLLAEMLRLLDQLSKPTIARVNGSAFGGGVGLIACCDIVLAASHAQFALTEVKLGLAPATISPYVVAAIGQRQARRYFLTAEKFDANQAREIGLVHQVFDSETLLDEAVNAKIEALLAAGPQALKATKQLIASVSADMQHVDDKLLGETAELIARLRTSQEGQERLSAFLSKNK